MHCVKDDKRIDECLVQRRKRARQEEDRERNPRSFSACRAVCPTIGGEGREGEEGEWEGARLAQYQRQQRIWHTVRVAASLYRMNLAALSAYRPPLPEAQWVPQPGGAPYWVPPHTYWHQLSDRPRPSVQTAATASGSAYRGSSTRHTIVRLRPGATSPGGVGVDIKHGSYDRYLNKLKGRSALRRGTKAPVPPVQGDKRQKTAIVAGCDCRPPPLP